METKDWEQIEDLFHATMALDAWERPHYLRQACDGNESLQKEVESLISALESSEGLMEQPAFELGMKVLRSSQAGSMVGTVVGAYKILEVLGRGGMGEVYLAEDTRLGRRVALKFLSPEFVGDNWAKRHLIKEAQAVAMLDHPNICPVYGIEEHENHSFIVMQYVEGKTLADIIRTQAFSADRVLPLAHQIVGALAEAHAHGIIHRDIKPKNIMVTNSGHARVLDFGLAKTIQQKQSSETAADSVSHLSQSGLVPGTIAYMSPEQLRAEKLDYRSDIFSLGTVLYEMVTGKNPYARDNNAEIISAVLTIKPASFKQTSAQTSREFNRIVQKCLEKKREDRYQSVSDLLLDLETSRNVIKKRRPISRHLTVRTAATFALLSLLLVVSIFVYFQVTRPRSVAVLPILNETGDQALEYLGQGLTDSVTYKLSGLSKLRVKPLTLVSGYTGPSVDPLKIGRDLGVDAVLVGRISGGKELPVLKATLLSTADGSPLWEAQYSIGLEQVFSIETDISQKVASKLEFRPADDQRRIRTVRGVQNAEARREYWLGRYFWRNRDNNNTLLAAIEHFNAAIKLEPTYAQAYAGLADCYAFGNVVAYGQMDTKEAMKKAEWAAKAALDLDDTLPEAHTSLGIVNMKYYWNWQEAERRFKRAIELNPDYAPAHYSYSSLLTITARTTESIAQSETAKDLDPFSPPTALNICRVLYFARRYDQASICFDKLVQEQPNYKGGRYARGLMYLQQAKYLDAVAIFEELYKGDKRLAGAALGYTYGVMGKQAEARRVLNEMEALSKPTNLPPQEIALIYLGLGDMDNALIRLEQSAEDHFAPFAYLAVDPMFQRLHADPRFINLLQRYNLPSPRPST
jgi:serine/threonine protein kinase/tetratricopeptide (TPR) repeat protein